MGSGCGISQMTRLEHGQTLGELLRNFEPVSAVSASCSSSRPQEEYYQVTMDEYGYSTGQPLYTTGAAPCLIVVIHETHRKIGCLAHVHNQVSLFPAVLAYVMLKSVEAMMATLGSSKVNVYLAAGSAFGPPARKREGKADTLPFTHPIDFSNLITDVRLAYDTPIEDVDFLGLLQMFMLERYSVDASAIIDQRSCQGSKISNVVYWPRYSRVLLLGDGDLEYVRAHEIKKSAQPGIDKLKAANRVVRVFDGNREALEEAPEGDLKLPNCIYPIRQTRSCIEPHPDGCPDCEYPCLVCGDDDGFVSNESGSYQCSECRASYAAKRNGVQEISDDDFNPRAASTRVTEEEKIPPEQTAVSASASSASAAPAAASSQAPASASASSSSASPAPASASTTSSSAADEDDWADFGAATFPAPSS